MKKYDNFCAALQNLKDIYLYEEPYDNVTHSYNRDVALDIIRQTKEQFYTLFCHLKDTIDKNWL